MNPWLERRVFHWAHQGGARENPSNTLRAMRHAVGVGAHGLELDVHATADRRLVVAHDDSLRRMCGVEGSIRTSILADLKRLDPAFNWVPGEVDAPDRDPAEYLLRGQGPEDPDLQIPELREVLEAFPTMPLTLELKATGFEGDLSSMLRDYGRADNVIVVSFRDSRVAKFRRAQPTVGTAPGRIRIGLFWIASRFGTAFANGGHVAVQIADRKYGVRFGDRRLVRAAHQRELAVHVWTVDEADRMRAAIEDGVDGIMTDRPSVLNAVLTELGVGWTP